MDGMPDVKALRRMRYAAHRCAVCGKLCQKQPAKCPGCGSLKFESISLQAPEYCKAFGHYFEEEPIPNSERREELHGTMRPRKLELAAMSLKFRQSCRRCGHKTTVRRIPQTETRPAENPPK